MKEHYAYLGKGFSLKVRSDEDMLLINISETIVTYSF